MHPYHHALSSQREYGGAIIDYLPLHTWFDASKSTLAHFTHRALNHHREGVAAASANSAPPFATPITPPCPSKRSACSI